MIYRVDMKRKIQYIAELIPKNEVIIEKVILLDDDTMYAFEEDLLEDWDFIKDNVDYMYQDTNNIDHCILVMRDGGDYGIVIQSEGYHYARYSAYFRVTEDFECRIWESFPKIKKEVSLDKNIPF